MSFSIAQLKTFVSVAEHGNIAEAAEMLGRTPSSVSMALKQLETHLGGSLFEAGRKSVLTPLGKYLMTEARDEIARFDRMAANIQAFARNEAGQLGIACVPSVAVHVLPAIIRAFADLYPQVDIEVRDMDSTEVAWAVERNRVEIGIASPMTVTGNLSYTEIHAEPFGVVVRRDSRLTALGRPVEWDDLEAERIIVNDLSSRIDDPRYRALTAHSRLHVPNATSLLAFVRNGLGVTLLPAITVADGDPALTVLPLATSRATRTLGIIKHAHRTLSPVAEMFERTVAEAFRNPYDPSNPIAEDRRDHA